MYRDIKMKQVAEPGTTLLGWFTEKVWKKKGKKVEGTKNRKKRVGEWDPLPGRLGCQKNFAQKNKVVSGNGGLRKHCCRRGGVSQVGSCLRTTSGGQTGEKRSSSSLNQTAEKKRRKGA